MKKCSKCKEFKTTKAFSLNRSMPDGYCHWCKKCTNERATKDRAAGKYRDSHRLRKYGLSPEEFNFMLLKQGGRCAVCGCDEGGLTKKGWSVDHCHSSLVVRGILCNNCNCMLGYAKDNEETLSKGIEYLRANQWEVVEK